MDRKYKEDNNGQTIIDEQVQGEPLVDVVVRPWGSFCQIAAGTGYQVKKIVVKPGEILSLQRHLHRSEIWVVSKGVGEVTGEVNIKMLDGEFDGELACYEIRTGNIVQIEIGAIHRLSNPGKIDLEVIEVQFGEYLGEDDIERFEDNYGRVEDKMFEELYEQLTEYEVQDKKTCGNNCTCEEKEED